MCVCVCVCVCVCFMYNIVFIFTYCAETDRNREEYVPRSISEVPFVEGIKFTTLVIHFVVHNLHESELSSVRCCDLP